MNIVGVNLCQGVPIQIFFWTTRLAIEDLHMGKK